MDEINLAVPAPRQRSVQWEFITKTNNGYIIYPLYLHTTQTGPMIMKSLQKEVKVAKSVMHWYNTKVQLEDAIISPYCVSNVEAQDYPRHVIIDSSIPRPDLTEAFHNPNILQIPNFIGLHDLFDVSIGTSARGRSHHAILIKADVSKLLLTSVVFGIVTFSIAVGLSVGFGIHSVGLGVAVCVGLIGIFGLIQTYLFGMKLL